MMKKSLSKRNFLVFVFLILMASVFADVSDNEGDLNPVSGKESSLIEKLPQEVTEKEPSEAKILKTETCVLELKTNVSGVEVFINGLPVGRTDLVLKDLEAGLYLVELKKPGYEDENFWVNMKAGKQYTYNVKMKLIVGFINFSGLPKKTEIHVDNTVVKRNDDSGSYTMEVVPGPHRVIIRSFGYTEEMCTVNVVPYETISLEVEMHECDFEMGDFTVSKSKINPKYKNKLGTAEFTFTVTASQPVTFTICNENDQTVFENSWQEFDKWLQIVKWNGRDSNGNILPDGEYVAQIESEHFIFSQKVAIETSEKFPIFSVNKNGTGVGSLPAVFADFKDKDVFSNASAVYFDMKMLEGLSGSSKRDGTYAMGSDFGVVLNMPHSEISFGSSFCPFYEVKLWSIYSCYKLRFYQPLSNGMNFGYGGQIRYGFASENMYDAAAFDIGNGLDFGLLCGIDGGWFNIGYSSQYIFAAKCGKLGKNNEGMKNNIWENGLTFTVQPFTWMSINAWTALNNLKSLEVGGGFVFMPSFASMLIDVNCDSYIIFGDCTYLDFGIVLSYLF